MYYIQMRYDGELETVDQFETRKEARSMLAEYRFSDSGSYYYISTRACKAWRDSKCLP